MYNRCCAHRRTLEEKLVWCVWRGFVLSLLFIIMTAGMTGCGTSEGAESDNTDYGSSAAVLYEAGKTEVLVPRMGDDQTVSAGPLTLDFSFADQGYFTGILLEKDKKINIQITGPDQVVYKYFIDQEGVTEVFPFTAGSGAYVVLVFEHIGNDQYAALMTHSLSVELENEFFPFLYPNQYVDFDADSEAVRLAGELSQEAKTDLDALNVIYQYVTEHIVYDEEKASSVQAGYLPDIDETLRTGKGICFDYASLTASMLRALSIPTRLEIGYSGDVRHAWVDIYIESMGWVENAIEFNGSEWNLMDPTFAAATGDHELTKEYVGDGSNYAVLYVR